jgi:ABC-2 type transport system ATP-binding protein
MSVLNVKGLSKNFKKLEAVKDVSFTLKEGEIVALIGPNGAGKTTTIKCIMGLLNKTSGQITINGFEHRSDAAKYAAAYIPETPDLYMYLTVWQHLKFIALAFNIKDWQPKAEEILKRFDLLDKKKEMCMNLSKGMKQKVSIGCALIHEPKVLFVDEPMIGLDPKSIHELKKILFSLKEQGKTVLLSTHLLDTAQSLCDEIMVMQRGSLIFKGTIEELRNLRQSSKDVTLEELFLEVAYDEK